MTISKAGLMTFAVIATSAALGVARALPVDMRASANTPLSGEGQQRQLLEQPDSWVAFEAKVRVFSPDMERMEGKIYRSSQGSQRLETGPAGGPIQTIDIRNIREQTHYLFIRFSNQKEASWTSAPMDVPEWGGNRPILRWADQAGLRRHPFRLSVRLGETPNIFATQGFEVYEYHDVGGNTHLQAPDLNMIDLVNQSITGRREEVYDVILREPPAEKFVPPPGVAVERLVTKRGMVAETTKAHLALHEANKDKATHK